MKQPLLLPPRLRWLSLLLWLPLLSQLQPQQALAQTTGCGTNGTSTLVLRDTAPVPTGTYTSSSTNGDKHPNGAAPGPETIRGTAFTYSNYTSTTTNATNTANTTNDFFNVYSAATQFATVDGRALTWRQIQSDQTLTTGNGGIANGGLVATNNDNTPFYSTVTLNFNREVSNLYFVVQDIDKGILNTPNLTANGGGSDFTDELDLYAVNNAGTRVALAAGNVTTVTNVNEFRSNITVNGTVQDGIRGLDRNGATNGSDRAGNVTIRFASPVRTVRLTFRNLNTTLGAGNGGTTTRIQTIAFEQISWCAQADLTTTIVPVSTPITPAATGQFNVTFSNAGDFATAATTQTVQLPAGLLGVSATTPTGITAAYNTVNGLLTYTINTATTAAANQPANYQGAFSSVISFTAPATGPVTATSSISSATTENAATAPDPFPNTATASIAITPIIISGNVFEDINYGGGSGRSIATANGVAAGSAVNVGTAGTPATAARVELYDNTGAFVAATTTSTTTGSVGQYTFSVPNPTTSYTVRVVSTSVRSTRTGSVATLVPVQTYNNGTTSVGGQYPARTEAANGASGTTLASLSPAGGTTGVQSVATVAVGTTNVTGVDFGYNFDLVVNTNNSGQGSLAQFITNANTLGGETSLAQSGSFVSLGTNTALPAQRETSIFMIPDGLAHNGLLASGSGGPASLLTGGVAVIAPTAALPLPALTGTNSPFTIINGSTQTFNIGNTNNVTLGTGGNVGTQATALTQLNGPEVQIVGSNAVAIGLDVANTATNVTIRGLAIYGFGNATDNGGNGNIRSAANNVTITQNVVGTTATTFGVPGTVTNADNVRLVGGTAGVVVSNNLIGYANGKGIAIDNGVTNVSVTGNEVRGNARTAPNLDGLDIQGSLATVTNNLFADNSGQGIDSYRSAGSNNITGNTVTNNGRGTTGLNPTEPQGIRIYGASNTIYRNIIADNYGSGITLHGTTGQSPATTTLISQNSIYNNGNVGSLNGLNPSGAIGIDLAVNGDGEAAGSSPFVTLNNASGTNGANALVNYPILRSATIVGTNLVLTGYAKPGATIELFTAQTNPATYNATGANFGQGRTYLLPLTEGATTGNVDSDPATNQTYGPGNINGFAQGTDNTASSFTYTIPLSSLPGVNGGTLLTATSTVGGATSEFSGVVATMSQLSGYVYEDVNYGGGSGRPRSAAGTSGRPNARVELYDNAGAFVSAATTDATGLYTFTTLPGNYTVRTVNSTVTSSRPGAVAGLVPVQTYVNGDANRVGGEAPEKVDAPAAGNQLLTFTAAGGGTETELDFVEVLDNLGNPVAGAVLNPSFETPSQAAAPYFTANPAGANWTFTGFSGIVNNLQNATRPTAPDGTQAAFLQGASTAYQTLALAPGTYSLRFRAASFDGNRTIQASINGTSVTAAITPVTGSYSTYTSSSFTVGPTTLGTLATTATAAQSVTSVTVASANVTGVDFGYNFSTVVNTNDTGQGSLRQFLTNSNTLTNAGLDQVASSNGGVDPAAGKEYSIFMIPDGAAHAGLRTGLVNQLTGATGSARAIITLPTGAVALPVSDANTVVYGISQTLNVGDTNAGTLGNGGTVGTDNLPFNPENRPEVEIAGNNVTGVFALSGTAATLQGLAIRGGNSQTIAITSTSFLLQNNIIGSGATAFAWANDGTVSGNYGINVGGGANGSVIDNLIGFTGNSGLNVNNGTGASLITVQDNEFTQNGYTSAGGDGISLGDGGGAGPLLIQQNLFTRSNSSAVQFEIGATSSTTITNNTIVSAGKGGAGFAQSQLEGSAICYLSRNGGNRTRTGVTDLINKNIIVDTQASAIVIGYGSQNTVISQNSIYNSGSVAIDLNTNPNAYVGGAGSGATEYGSGDGVTINDGNDPGTAASSLANKGVDYPVLTTIDLAGTSLTISGFSRPGAVIEFFIPELDPTRFGEGRTYLATRTEGVSDADGTTGSYGPGAINGVAQGTDAAANRFKFTISVAGLTPAQLTQLQNVGVTSTATLLNSTSEFSPNVPFSSDVLATITAAASPIASGQPASFNVTFNNIGGSTAAGVVASVQLPAGLTGVTVSGGGSYNSTTGLVSYAGITTLNPATPVTSTITYTQPINNLSVTGVAAVSTTTNQNGATANDSQSATILTNPAFDLLTTLGGPATTVAGQLTTYAVTTQNNGPGAAPNAVQTVSFTTAAALSNVFVSNGGTYVYSGGTSTFTFPVPVSLPQGQVVNNFFSFLSPTSGPLNLTALVTPNTTGAGETNTGNNTATLSTTVSAAPATQANVYTTISSNAANGSAAPAAAVTYTVVQGNNGPSAATGVVTQVALSPNLTATGFTVNGAAGTPSGTNINFTITGGTATYSQTTGILTLPTIATQASAASTTYTVVAPAPNSGQLTVTSSVSATTADPVPADNEAATTVTVNNALTADLATTIVGPSTATAGQPVTYTVTTANNGPGTAQNVVQTVNAPAGLPITGTNAVRINGALPTSTGSTTATYAGGITYNAATGVVTIASPSGVGAPGTAASNTITYMVPVNSGSLTNVAVVRSTSPDGVTTNNTASVTTTVQTQADVAVYISGPTSSTVGSPITYAVTTVNNGPSVSNTETTTVQLPSALAGVEVRGYDGAIIAGAYNSTSGVVTFPAVTNQPVGGPGTVVGSITFNTPNTTVITPSATAAVGSNVDPNLGNNVASISVGIVPATTTTIDLVASFNAAPPATATAGASITFTVRGANATATATTGVVQDVFLNAGLTTTGFTVGGSAGTLSGDVITFPGGITYSQTTGVLSIPLGNLGASTGVNTAIVQPAPGTGPYAITTTIRGNDTDTNTGNNRATNTVTITPSVDVATTVTGPASAAIGSTVTYAVVTTNNGPSPASNVVQTVTLPAGVLASSVVITGGGTLSGSTVTFPTINNMAVGSNGTVTNSVSFTVPNTTPSITVTGNVTATGDAGTTGNNVSAQVTTTQPNRPPVADDVVNTLQAPEGNTAVTQLPISPLQATDADGNTTIVTYTITSIPNAGTQGTLYYDNGGTYTAVAVNQTLSPTQATTLRFTPVTGYVGNVFFNYTATDNGNAVPANVLSSNTATYTIQVGQDNPAVYTQTPVKGGTTNPYANNDILASVIDPNGAQYTSAGAITYAPTATNGPLASGDNGTRTVVLNSGPLPAGTRLDPITGLITVTDYTQLVPGSYPLTITTTDVFGGVTVHNITLVIGGSPIAVDDMATTTPNTPVTFAVAANDLPNGGAAIAPGTIDLDPNTAGTQTSITTAQGTFTTVGAPTGSVTFTPASATFTGTATTPYVISNSATPAAVSNQANLIVTVRNQPYDLATSITSPATGATVTAGASLTFTVLAQNNGPVAATNAVQTLQLPAGLGTVTFGTPTVGAGATITGSPSYNNTTGLVTFPTISTQASGATGNVTFTATITVPGSTPLTAVATVQAANNVDPTPANNTATVTLNVTPAFDLLTTINGPTSVVTGDLATYVVTTRNNGPSAVSNAVQTVTIPSGLSGVFITNGGTYNSGTGVVTFPAVALGNGQAVNNTISFAPTAGYTATASVTPTSGDTNTGNNTASIVATVSGATANVANNYVTVSGPALVNPGATATYTVTQGNYGPNQAANVATIVSLPTGLSTTTLTLSGTTGTTVTGTGFTFTGGVNNGATYNTQTGVLTLPTLATQNSAATPQTYTIGITAPNAGPALTVTASVTSTTTDPVPGDNVATVQTQLQPSADVAITISGPASIGAGQVATYVVQTVNNSTTASQGVVQTVSIPAGLTAAGLQLNGATGTLSLGVITFTGGATYNVGSGLLTLPTITTLLGGAAQSNIVSYPAPAVATAATLYNVASVRSTTPDGVTTNNTATATTSVTPVLDVVVQVSGPAAATVGNPVSYTITTTNNGPSTSGTQTVTAQLATGLTGVEVRDNNGAIVVGAYNSTTGIVTFAATSVTQPGQSTVGTIRFIAPNTPQLSVEASVATSATDANLDNNTARVSTPVSPTNLTAADIQTTIASTLTGNQVAGTTNTYTITTTNNGPNPAQNVVRTVNIPANLDPTTIQVAGATGTPSGGVVTFPNGSAYTVTTGVLTLPTLATLANTASSAITVSFPLPGRDETNYTLAIVANSVANNPDGVPANNVATNTAVTVTPRADVTAAISGPAATQAGQTVTYTVSTGNNGPSAAPGVNQTFVLPAGVTSYTLNGVTTAGSGTITIAVGTLLNGASVANVISFTAPTATFNVSGAASTTGTDPVPGNNSATMTTTIGNIAPLAYNVVNTLQSPESNTATAPLPISPLAGSDADGTVASYTVLTLPTTTQGVLYVWNGTTNVVLNTTNFPGLVLTPTQAGNLRFDPAATFAGSVSFTYQATDNGTPALTSNVATYTIQSGVDNPALYTVEPPKGGIANPYNNNDILASVIDPNGAQYTSLGAITYNAPTGAVATGDNGTRTVVLNSGPLPAGTTLNPTTGLITVTDYTQLVPGSYPLTITTTDVFGGVTVHNITLVIGGSPIAVDDFATTNLNTAVTFAVAANDLANGGAAINPSTIDLDPNTAGIQTSITTAQGTFTTVGAAVGSVTFTPASATFTGTATTPYTINNSATPAAVSNQANLVVTVRGPLPVDLSTTISATLNPVNAGASETLTVTSTNNSTTTASANTVLTVQLPSGLTTTGFTVGGSASTASTATTITFGTTATYNVTTGLLTYASTTLAANTTTSSAIVFPAPAASFTATSQIGNGTTDPTPANNTASVPVTVTPQFDLTTSLTGPASVVTGDLATFTVVSRNNGPSAVSNAVQTVQLPTGLTGVFVTGGGYYNATASSQTLYFVNGMYTTTNPGGTPTTYTLAAGGVIFPPATLSSGQAIANSISFAPTATFLPSALITPNTTPAGETNTGNNTGYLNGAGALTAVTVTGATTNRANVYVTLTGPATVNPGATATYTVTQGNNGPNQAASVMTTVSLPTGLTSLTIDGTTASAVGNTITLGTASYNTLTGVLTFGTLTTQNSAATPESHTLAFAAPASGTYNVTGNVATSTTDPVPGDNVASVMTNIAPSADVATTISGPASATAGQPVTFNVTTTNTSGVPATGVAQTVSLPAGLLATDLRVGGALGTGSTTITFPNGATYNVNTGVLTLATIATLPANGTQTTAIVFTAPGNATSLSLTAASTTTSYDGVPANNRSTVTTTLTANSDVVVAIAGPASVTTGNPVTYTVTTTNNGPSVAGSETTTVQLPTGLTGVVVRDNTGTIVAGAYNSTTGVVTFAAVTNLLPGQGNAQTGTITFLAPNTVRLDVAAVASVPAATGDPNLDNNQATAVTSVSPASPTTADVAVTLSPNVTTQTAGSPVVYTLTTQNNTAANSATNVVRTVELPAGLTSTTLSLNGTTSTNTTNGLITFTGGPNNGATYNTATGVLTLPTIASLVNGTPVVTTITVTASNGPLVAAATVAGANTDPNTANNTAQATNVTLNASNDVATYLTAPASAAVGSPVTYSVVTANNGPSNVSSIVQTVTLPTGVTSVSSAPVGYTLTGSTLTYTVSNLSSGSSQTNVITFAMPNVATAAGSAAVPTTNDPTTGNNTSNATTTRPNQAPVAQDVVNTLQSPEGNTATAPLPISPLAGTDADGTVASYTVLSLPSATQGILYVWNGTANVELNTANFPGLVLTPTQAGNLRFDPAATFAGTVNFTYQTTDNLGALSNAGRYTIQSGVDNASTYVNTPVHVNTNTNPYVTGNVISYVVDPNGAAYNGAALVYNATTGAQQAGTSNGLATSGINALLTPVGTGVGQTPAPGGNPTNTLPSGLSLDPITGQIYVSNGALLANPPTAMTYTVNITTTDVYGGVTTQPVSFTLSAYPLPVELTVFTAKAVQLDGVLAWNTASEKNNDHFEVERSLDGRSFTTIGEVKGQGSKTTPTAYTLTDARIGARVNGPVYYRLKQVDVDGTSSYSPVRTVAFTKAVTPAISLYPNPAVGETSLDLSQVPTGSYQVSIIDATGRVILGLNLEAGLVHTLDLTEVASGTYSVLLRGTSPDGAPLNLTKRLIKN